MEVSSGLGYNIEQLLVRICQVDDLEDDGHVSHNHMSDDRDKEDIYTLVMTTNARGWTSKILLRN